MYARIWAGAQFIIYITKFSHQMKDGNAADKSDSAPSSWDSESQAGSESEDGDISKPDKQLLAITHDPAALHVKFRIEEVSYFLRFIIINITEHGCHNSNQHSTTRIWRLALVMSQSVLMTTIVLKLTQCLSALCHHSTYPR